MDAETRALLQLSRVPGAGPRTIQALRAVLGSAQNVVQASPSRLRSVPGVGPQLVAALVDARLGTAADEEWRRCQDQRVELIPDFAPRYPRLLREIPDPPPILYAQGDWHGGDSLAVAIVGTRHASRYGLRQAESLARSLSHVGLTIVSGLARGIDAAAHRATLTTGGRTLAVLAGGLSEIYPPEHRDLAAAIRVQGALLSEVPLDGRPRRGAFPRRNRLISGLSLGVVVVEATPRSGALITARHALEQGREVFAVPGPIDSPASRGCHQLIRDGAKLVESVDDILDELGPLVEPLENARRETVHDGRELQLNSQEHQVLQAIDADEVRVDLVVERSGLPVHRVLATLSVLETRHLIQRVGGDRVTRR